MTKELKATKTPGRVETSVNIREMLFPLAMTLGIAGFVIEYLAWTIGFGAVALTRFRRKVDSRTVDAGPAA